LALVKQVSRENKFDAVVGSAPNFAARRAAPPETPPLRFTTPKCSRTRWSSWERRKGARRAL